MVQAICSQIFVYQPFRVGKRMCIKSVTSFVKILSSVGYKIFYFISSNIFLLYKTTLTTAQRLFLLSLSITDNIVIQPILKGKKHFYSCFPGTISPKIEYTASIKHNTKCIKCNRIILSQSHGEKRIMKNLYEIGANQNKNVHQKPVCHAHTKQRHR